MERRRRETEERMAQKGMRTSGGATAAPPERSNAVKSRFLGSCLQNEATPGYVTSAGTWRSKLRVDKNPKASVLDGEGLGGGDSPPIAAREEAEPLSLRSFGEPERG